MNAIYTLIGWGISLVIVYLIMAGFYILAIFLVDSLVSSDGLKLFFGIAFLSGWMLCKFQHHVRDKLQERRAS